MQPDSRQRSRQRATYTPDAQLFGDVLVLLALRGQQHNLRTPRQPDAGVRVKRASRVSSLF